MTTNDHRATPERTGPASARARDAVLAREDERDRALGITHHFAAVNGVRLHYAACGNASRPLMLFVHGFPEFWYEWRALLPEFGRDHYAVAPDLRGYNLSEKPAESKAYRAKSIIEDLRQLMGHLGHRSCVLVAHDWGGAIAWNFAAAHPDAIDALVAINAAHTATFARDLVASPEQQAASAYMLLYRSRIAEDLVARNRFAYLRAKLCSSTPDARWFDDETEARYVEAWSQPGALTGGLNYYRATPMAPSCGADPGAAALTLNPDDFVVRVPTLVIWGDRDPYLLPGLLDGLDRFVPDLRVIRDPASSHWIVHERPQFVIDAIRGWLAERAIQA